MISKERHDKINKIIDKLIEIFVENEGDLEYVIECMIWKDGTCRILIRHSWSGKADKSKVLPTHTIIYRWYRGKIEYYHNYQTGITEPLTPEQSLAAYTTVDTIEERDICNFDI